MFGGITDVWCNVIIMNNVVASYGKDSKSCEVYFVCKMLPLRKLLYEVDSHCVTNRVVCTDDFTGFVLSVHFLQHYAAIFLMFVYYCYTKLSTVILSDSIFLDMVKITTT